ncbi:PQQ-binding-like beta-propeller repeat protein [Jannaschia pohangensis]|uniref:Outer membrane protein assembly factor BamB, contains PQQ-like beta-propeller repeat n=1 Tax=Jannaschia pohangensis TaxID=390807 RepID=A0A1I3I9G2_9RHOB|nr:PQQ-binding-like beta-propeller repeat protein [Jannaschia pohangensis]SFI44645.1 Outer membrane protein assembly factor BamB, contains PQQ-like beta-propeller repeat [Jannaschia pohangensis]
MIKIAGILMVAGLVLTACGEDELILPGERLPVRAGDAGGIGVIASAAQDAAEVPGLSLPAARRLADWPMRVGNESNDPGHATLSANPQLIWSANIGTGDSRRQRITADPVSDGSRIFTVDAKSTVTATAPSGAVIWSRSLVPGFERDSDASGGGAAVVGGTLYVSTGYGELHALDAGSGQEKWVQRLDAPITTPKVAGGLVYLVSRDNRAWAIDTDTGRIQWELPAAPATNVMATAPAPAITGRAVIFPFGSGELTAALRQSGVRVWGSSVSGARRGVAYNDLGDITGDPVVSDGVVYAGTTAGRMIAVSVSSGLRQWTADEGAVSPLAAAGGSVFAVSDRAQLLRLDAETGQVLWRQDLPFYRNQRLKRRQGVYAHFGPVLAGGRLWVASSDGVLRGFDPASGALQSQVEIPSGAASRPIAFGDALYVVGRSGTLHAFR